MLLKRLIVTSAIFFLLITALVVPDLIRIRRRMSRDTATGVGFVVGSRTENLFRIAVLCVVAIVAYWLSGRLLEL